MTTILHILQHALGRDEYGRSRSKAAVPGKDYRNHFVAGADDVSTCREAVLLGLMVEHPSGEISGGDPWFHVTEAGKAYIDAHSPKPPKLTRGQRRYQEWLDADRGMTFGEWIKGKHGRRRPSNMDSDELEAPQ